MHERSVQLFRLGEIRFYQGEYREAIELFEESFAIEPNAQALRGIGECCVALERSHEAILYFAASTGLRPDPQVSYELARALLNVGFLDEARRAAERTVAALPDFKMAVDLCDEIRRLSEQAASDEV